MVNDTVCHSDKIGPKRNYNNNDTCIHTTMSYTIFISTSRTNKQKKKKTNKKLNSPSVCWESLVCKSITKENSTAQCRNNEEPQLTG